MANKQNKTAIDHATEKQLQAANPTQSIALRASAGSGKTKVLIDRFVRLCIEDTLSRAHPRSILAITFTKKAAIEIQSRLITRAQKMALAEPAELASELKQLFGGREAKPNELKNAASLYELVLEDLSALNVGTIHAFCQTVLGRFGAESGFDPNLRVLENSSELIDEALEQLEMEIAADDSGEMSQAMATIAKTPGSLRLQLNKSFKDQMRLERWFDRVAGRREMEIDGLVNRVRVPLLPSLLQEVRGILFPDLNTAEEPSLNDYLPRLASELTSFATSGLENVKQYLGADYTPNLENPRLKLQAKVMDLATSISEKSCLENPAEASDLVKIIQSLFIKVDGALKSFTSIKDAELKARFNLAVIQEALLVLALLQRLNYMELYQVNRGILRLTLRLFDIYDALKRRDRVVDFQDLEDLARRLLGDHGRAMSLLLRLDDSLRHMLLDEYQDTNFNQEDLLQPLVDEFLSGGTNDNQRTVFFVGDIKQSIYRFRGAEPSIFRNICDRLEGEEGPLNLPTNFRSLEAVVGSVGSLFNTSPLAERLSEDERLFVRQEFSRTDTTGVVHILDPYEKVEDHDSEDGHEKDERNEIQVAADAAVEIVQQLEQTATTSENSQERNLRWGDFLVLFRSRTDISVYEKAFREAGIPIVPSGRGMLTASREIQDILALLHWLVYPENDVALATVLRSPVFQVSEEHFQDLLARRKTNRPNGKAGYLPPKGLWQTLVKLEDEPLFGRIVITLKGWRKHLGFDDCHALLRRIFRQQDLLERYQQVFGDQARYNLLRLFDLALSSEVAGSPTIRRLIELIERSAELGSEDEGTLPQTEDQGRISFMTIHGSKGLEKPVVLLVDAYRKSGQTNTQISTHPDSRQSPLIFKVTKKLRNGFSLPDDASLPQDQLQSAAAHMINEDLDEEANLIYVAMTRARDQLYVLGSDKGKGQAAENILFRAAKAANCPLVSLDDPTFLTRPPVVSKFERGQRGTVSYSRFWQPPTLKSRYESKSPSTVETSETNTSFVATEPDQPSYSHTGTRQQATERGQRIHLMLQMAADTGLLPPATCDESSEAASVFNDHQYDWIFRPQYLGGIGCSEVPFVHNLTNEKATTRPTRIHGIIDRLVLKDGYADIIDYKTNRYYSDPDRQLALVEHYRPQLDLYKNAIAAVYPELSVRCWLLFTEPLTNSSVEQLVEVK